MSPGDLADMKYRRFIYLDQCFNRLLRIRDEVIVKSATGIKADPVTSRRDIKAYTYLTDSFSNTITMVLPP